MISALIALLFSFLPAAMQELPDAFPREGAKQLIDNARVSVWEATWTEGKPTVMHRHRFDMVVVDLADSTTKATGQDGTSNTATQRVGQASFIQKGTTHIEEGVSDVPRHSILINLKDITVPPLENKSGYPAAFPREGSRKLLDNARVVIWDYSWTPGKPTAMHFHDKDVVVVYLNNGDLSSTTPDGKVTVNPYTLGETRFNPRDRAHSELLVKGTQRVIAVELK